MKRSTRAVHPPLPALPSNRPARPALYQSAAWTFDSLAQVDAVFDGEEPGAFYNRYGGPDHARIEAALADLHGADGALLTNGGMAALTAAVLACVRSGDHVVSATDLYGTSTALFDWLDRFGVTHERVDVTDLDAVRAALPARLLLCETVSNPRMRVANLPALAALCEATDTLLLVDNTFATPIACRPLEHGANIVIESVTKFLNGHHDVVLGAVICDDVGPARSVRTMLGLAPSPFDSWLALRGLETLDVRLRRAADNAVVVAEALADHGLVVHFPGLTGHPDHLVATEVLDTMGAMLSFELPDRAAVEHLLANCAPIRLALSLGGVASTLSHPATSSHRNLSVEQRESLGLHDGFLRMSVGIEAPVDIVSALFSGLP